jgi:hypothetical protein
MPSPGITVSNGVIELQIEGIKNPNTMEQTDSFSLSTRTTQGDIIDETTTDLVVQIDEPADIAIEQVTFFSKTVG